jgi:hypothetical protein
VATRPIYELVVPDGIDVNNTEYYDTIIKNAASYIVGDGVAVDSNSYTKKLTSFENNANDAWNLFKSTYTDGATPETTDVFNIPMS